MIAISIEGLAAMLADAYTEGHEAGHMLIPLESPEALFIGFQEAVEGMCDEHTRH